jgi:hypothetical protein
MEERARLFDMMREAAYADPVIKIVKDAILTRLEALAVEAREQQTRRALQRRVQVRVPWPLADILVDILTVCL